MPHGIIPNQKDAAKQIKGYVAFLAWCQSSAVSVRSDEGQNHHSQQDSKQIGDHIFGAENVVVFVVIFHFAHKSSEGSDAASKRVCCTFFAYLEWRLQQFDLKRQ